MAIVPVPDGDVHRDPLLAVHVHVTPVYGPGNESATDAPSVGAGAMVDDGDGPREWSAGGGRRHAWRLCHEGRQRPTMLTSRFRCRSPGSDDRCARLARRRVDHSARCRDSRCHRQYLGRRRRNRTQCPDARSRVVELPCDASADVSDVLPAGVRSYRREHHRAATTRERASGHWAPCRRLDRDIDGDGARHGIGHCGEHGDAPVEHTGRSEPGERHRNRDADIVSRCRPLVDKDTERAGRRRRHYIHVDRRRRQPWPQHCAGASVADSFPAPFTGVTWTCTAEQRIECRSVGHGMIATTVDLLAGGSATFVATGLSAPVRVSSPLVNVATVAVAAGTTDPDLSNNSDTSAVGLASLADVQVSQAGPSFLAPGTSGDYLITIANVGPSQTAARP